MRQFTFSTEEEKAQEVILALNGLGIKPDVRHFRHYDGRILGWNDAMVKIGRDCTCAGTYWTPLQTTTGLPMRVAPEHHLDLPVGSWFDTRSKQPILVPFPDQEGHGFPFRDLNSSNGKVAKCVITQQELDINPDSSGYAWYCRIEVI